MITKNTAQLILASLLLCTITSCQKQHRITHIATTNDAAWVENAMLPNEETTQTIDIEIDVAQKNQVVDGFGACFNELGWSSLSLLTDSERATILKELFAPNYGANFNICRMPVAANDFSLDWYSYNETAGDYKMENFSIARDEKYLIPFIKSAQVYNPKLKIWASPWSPPSWMKTNNHYASKYNGDSPRTQYHNGLAEDNQGFEGEDMFIQTEENLAAYALYFSKFIEAYRAKEIDIFAIMPQNEFNSAQVFPSCCWKSFSLANFMGNYLIPEMNKLDVKTFFGTVERADHLLVDTVLNQAGCLGNVNGVGFQWAGKGSVGEVHRRYPHMKLYQTEQECGNGKNDWHGVQHSWDLLKHYFDNGVAAYMYWNISLLEGGISRWGWAQNSLVVVDPVDNSYRFTPEYYLMKHISHFVKEGAHHISVPNDFEGLVFENPDKSIVVLFMEKQGKNSLLKISIAGREECIAIAANSINTILL